MTHKSLFEIPNIITPLEITALLNYYYCFGTDSVVFSIEETPFYFIIDRLKERFGDVGVRASFIESRKSPLRVHSDFSIGLRNKYNLKDNDNYPYYSTLIPLSYQVDMYTVVFNEASVTPMGSSQEYCHLPKINTEFTDFEIKLLSHVSSGLLKKLSIKKIFNWRPGTASCWPITLLHCSGDFDSKLSERIWLSIWLDIKCP
jgi:hypothetical protein